MSMLSNAEEKQVMLFLGAGASAEARIPAMRELAIGFRRELDEGGSSDEKRLRQVLASVLAERQLGVIEHKGKAYVDLEVMLAALYSLRDTRENVAFGFLRKRGCGNARTREKLEKRIKDFIHDRMRPRQENLDYLQPLVRIARNLEGLDVFTVNYDTCVEHVCEALDAQYTDGFGPMWDPTVFDLAQNLIRLHKLHGSINWFAAAGPIRSMHRYPLVAHEALRASKPEGLSELMVYPLVPKGSVDPPWLDLFNRFDKALNAARVCIVIGYSFRDAYIADLFLRNMISNPKLLLLIVGPSAPACLQRLLDRLDSGLTAMRIAARCRLLPLKASRSLRNDNIYHDAQRMDTVDERAERVLRSPDPDPHERRVEILDLTTQILDFRWDSRAYTWLVDRRRVAASLMVLDPTNPRSVPALVSHLLSAVQANDEATARTLFDEFKRHFRNAFENGSVGAGCLRLKIQKHEFGSNIDLLQNSARAAKRCEQVTYAWRDEDGTVRTLLSRLAGVLDGAFDEFQRYETERPIKSTNAWKDLILPYYNEIQEVRASVGP